MISRLRGTIIVKDFEGVVIDVHGIGFRVSVPMTSLERLPPQGEEVELYTLMNVREDAMDLYGFADEADRTVFARLIKVSGVGPKLGMSFLSSFGGPDVVNAVLRGDLAALRTVKGVGKRTAERLVLELKDAFGKIDLGTAQALGVGFGGKVAAHGMMEDLRSALGNLGFPPPLIEKAVAEVISKGEAQSIDDMLRAALRVLRKR